jgi:hypothetical protein
LARWGFKTLIATAERLKIEEPLLPRWKEMLSKMQDYNINENGIMIGKNVPFDKPHRHYSHLFAIFPLFDMNIETETERISMMKKSIQHFTDLDGDNCIYKFSGASSLWAAVGEGDNALKWLERALELLPRFAEPPAPKRTPTATPNTFYSERENPTFESPVSASRSMLDMYLQDWGGKIRVFPAMPSAWKEASFYNLRTEGAFLISAVRKEGKTKFMKIESLAGEPCIIKTDFEGDLKIVAPKSVKIKRQAGFIELNLKKGQSAIIYTGKMPNTFEISPLPVKKEERNSWGMKMN